MIIPPRAAKAVAMRAAVLSGCAASVKAGTGALTGINLIAIATLCGTL
jgi:hypothetical protein